MNVQVFLVVAAAVILLFTNAEAFRGTKSVGRAFEAAGWKVQGQAREVGPAGNRVADGQAVGRAT